MIISSTYPVAPSSRYQLEARADARAANKWLQAFRVLMIVGAITLVGGLIFGGTRFWAALLLTSLMLLGLGLAGTMRIATEYLSGAGWSVACRRVPEAMTAFLPWGALGILMVLVLHPSLYPWTKPEYGEHFSRFKACWLSRPFFLARAVAYLAIWILFARTMVRNSRRLDETGDLRNRQRNVAASGAFAMFFGFSVWLASVDWVMSLEPHWYSTIYGMYFFSGLMSSGLACIILLGLWLRQIGPWRGVLNEEHLHDLGKLVLTFCTLWMYLWFSQYMLIWYANISEETSHYVPRVHGTWGSLMIVNILLNWAVPFFTLLSRRSKRDGRIMAQIAVVLLLGRALDLFIMIGPTVFGPSALPDVSIVGLMLGMIGLAGTVFWRAMKQAPVLPVRDPLLAESLHYHQ